MSLVFMCLSILALLRCSEILAILVLVIYLTVTPIILIRKVKKGNNNKNNRHRKLQYSLPCSAIPVLPVARTNTTRIPKRERKGTEAVTQHSEKYEIVSTEA